VVSCGNDDVDLYLADLGEIFMAFTCITKVNSDWPVDVTIEHLVL